VTKIMKAVYGKRSSFTGKGDGYHHGDLRAALLKSEEEIIRGSGVEGLTLRACARRAGVSHGAPAHHFGNIAGLLTEFEVEGFDRLTEAMGPLKMKDADDELQPAGLGYIQFAMRWPEHFRVMWRSELLYEKSPRLQTCRAIRGCLVERSRLCRTRGGRQPQSPALSTRHDACSAP
jgi:AcrR family transcriptional regulator